MKCLSRWMAPAILSACLAGFGCASQKPAATSIGTPTTAPAGSTDYDHAVAVIHPVGDSKVTGVVYFSQEGPDSVRVIADIDGLTPGKHGFHVHDFGDCRDMAKAMSTGGHYNPGMAMHGLPSSPMHMAGDMGNIEADASGHGHLEILLTGITIGGDPAPILGRSVIIHEKEDDGTGTTGNAGGRVGCGVIGVENVAWK